MLLRCLFTFTLTKFSKAIYTGKAHEIILKESRKGAKEADEAGDDGTNDVLVSDVIRTNERHVWFISEHLVNAPTVEAD